jgi:hypothetical protein
MWVGHGPSTVANHHQMKGWLQAGALLSVGFSRFGAFSF